ncbi:MAG: phosphatidylserine synthase [Arcobacter butzleri]|nr:CDP-alcohol phosphatidyltransferase family protein [Arcobacteraceae bacterium]MDY0364836.1 CDP-alcohol phosphatidyltransferase family protein [Arcobacteraceae bacterium]NLO18242.1 phosphatidylserine synthase [Aliarcobacter butzleri]
MSFLFNKYSHFNLANLATFMNIVAGILAFYFITHGEFYAAILFAWIGGAFDILDGKIARKYNLSTDFGVQLDSYADFLSFVLVPVLFLYFAIFDGKEEFLNFFIVSAAFIYYVISGLRRLVHFNLTHDAGELNKYFTGVPTPLGAILMMFVYFAWEFEIFFNEYIILAFIVLIASLLNSKLKIPHP